MTLVLLVLGAWLAALGFLCCLGYAAARGDAEALKPADAFEPPRRGHGTSPDHLRELLFFEEAEEPRAEAMDSKLLRALGY